MNPVEVRTPRHPVARRLALEVLEGRLLMSGAGEMPAYGMPTVWPGAGAADVGTPRGGAPGPSGGSSADHFGDHWVGWGHGPDGGRTAYGGGWYVNPGPANPGSPADPGMPGGSAPSTSGSGVSLSVVLVAAPTSTAPGGASSSGDVSGPASGIHASRIDLASQAAPVLTAGARPGAPAPATPTAPDSWLPVYPAYPGAVTYGAPAWGGSPAGPSAGNRAPVGPALGPAAVAIRLPSAGALGDDPRGVSPPRTTPGGLSPRDATFAIVPAVAAEGQACEAAEGEARPAGGGAEARAGDPEPHRADVLTDFLPFSRTTLENAIGRFLGRFEGAAVGPAAGAGPADLVTAAVALAVAVAGARGVVRALDTPHDEDDAPGTADLRVSLGGAPGLPDPWALGDL